MGEISDHDAGLTPVEGGGRRAVGYEESCTVHSSQKR